MHASVPRVDDSRNAATVAAAGTIVYSSGVCRKRKETASPACCFRALRSALVLVPRRGGALRAVGHQSSRPKFDPTPTLFSFFFLLLGPLGPLVVFIDLGG